MAPLDSACGARNSPKLKKIYDQGYNNTIDPDRSVGLPILNNERRIARTKRSTQLREARASLVSVLDVLGKRYEIISDHRCSVRIRFAKRIKSHLMNERKKSLCSELFICFGCARIFLEERKMIMRLF